MARSPIEAMIDAAVRCVLCGEPSGCDCWARCIECGWRHQRTCACNNPNCIEGRRSWFRAVGDDVAEQVMKMMDRRFPIPNDEAIFLMQAIKESVFDVLKKDIEGK
jgi:hypothetical protein